MLRQLWKLCLDVELADRAARLKRLGRVEQLDERQPKYKVLEPPKALLPPPDNEQNN